MRLKDIATVVERELPNLKYGVSDLSGNLGIRDFQGAIRATETIRRTGALKAETERVLRVIDVARNVHDVAVVNRPTYDEFRAAIDNLKARSDALIDAIRSIIPEDVPELVSVRLPEERHLTEIGKTMADVEQALAQIIINPHVGGSVDVLGFDRGSNWVDVLVATPLAVAVIGSVLRLICEFQAKQADIALRLEVVCNLGLQNDAVAAAEKTLEHELVRFMDEEVASIATKAGVPNDDHEYRERLKVSVKVLSGLIQRGLEIRPSLTAPAETAETFPTPGQLAAAAKLLEGAKKEIESGEAR